MRRISEVVAIFCHDNKSFVFFNFEICSETRWMFVVKISEANQLLVCLQLISFLFFVVEKQNIVKFCYWIVPAEQIVTNLPRNFWQKPLRPDKNLAIKFQKNSINTQIKQTTLVPKNKKPVNVYALSNAIFCLFSAIVANSHSLWKLSREKRVEKRFVSTSIPKTETIVSSKSLISC